MTTRPLDLTQRQIRALCKGAKKEGYVPVIEFGNTVVKLVPEEHVVTKEQPTPVDEETASSAYERWKAGRNVRVP